MTETRRMTSTAARINCSFMLRLTYLVLWLDVLVLFLACAGWCLQTGRDPRSCDFHDPSQSLWFPTVEET